ncbi:allophanate hydrolase [Asticcacaulis sp. EMRT-3]|uniref:allophanate hydrolase n=1 Tax=Asticcacaulis sp. EMRT-3 TaxID=3040349 RepID=UPI0024AEF0ED|nr:allophanate hydrolase [Asticcacaulis sp. EMRT-3]MDI7775637.1 allophanate hydrolase [Asticcacaulis sp. EMRT-3]
MADPSSSDLTGRSLDDWVMAGSDPTALRADLLALVAALDPADPAWISRVTPEALMAQLDAAARRQDAGADMPLFGVPFAVKDNIDVAGFDTTAACPAFAYRPDKSATVVERLMATGALMIGKTNLDQFATGLVGTRSPYGAVPNSFDPAYVSGGSSSGTASVVARGLVPFALGTDTAGSGRVPAGANNLVGFKPTRGAWSTKGLVPACRTLDCITVMTTCVADAVRVDEIVRGYDAGDALSRQPLRARELPVRPRLAIPADPQFFGDAQAKAAWAVSLAKLDAELVPVDFAPLHAVAALLYEGAWVAERLAAIEGFFDAHAAEMDPTVRAIIGGAKGMSATDTFRAFYRLAELAGPAQALMASVDALLVPTVPAHPTLAAVAADPVTLNSRLGTYTNFVNLLDWSAVAVPAGFRADGLPFGLTLIGPVWAERALASVAARWEARFNLPRGAFSRLRPKEITTMPAHPGAEAAQ